MKCIFLFFMILIACPVFLFSQNRGEEKKAEQYIDRKGEVYFTFCIHERKELDLLTRIISISNVKDNRVYAYANRSEFSKFLDLKYNYEVLPHPGEPAKEPAMFHLFKKKERNDWNAYPTYEAYDSMMHRFQTDYPLLCQTIDAGISVEGRKILFVKISDHPEQREFEPRVMYSSTMHGDETAGYVLMLRLIDYLLSNYGKDAEVTRMVDSMEIWINPLANPDGTYNSGNHTVYGATRYNANSVDLNRNYPDFIDGEHPDGKAWQPENLVMMKLTDSLHFALSANFHGGQEVVNYPWDGQATLHTDNNWWIYVSRQYADTVHSYSPADYMDFMNNGITNGNAWYGIFGGRQDYITYYKHGREFTVELTGGFIVDAASLPAYWNYNYRSLLNYLKQAMFGIRGIVTDSVTGKPLNAMVFISGHDVDNSHVFSELPMGDYYRMLYKGIYDVTYSCYGYYSKTITVTIANDSSTRQDVQLVPWSMVVNDDFSSSFRIYPNPSSGYVYILSDKDFLEPFNIRITNLMGEELRTEKQLCKNNHEVILSPLPRGLYFVNINAGQQTVTRKLIIE